MCQGLLLLLIYVYIVREMRKLCRHFHATCQHYLLELEGRRKFLSLFTCIVAGETEHKEGISQDVTSKTRVF